MIHEPLLRNALHRITARIFALALLGNAVLFLFGWAWLYVPDSHIYQFLFSMLFGAVLIAAFLSLHTTLIHRLYPAVCRPLWQRALILAGWLLLGHILQHTAGLLSANIDTRAGYWNSQLSAHHRAFFTFERLSHWQHLALEAFQWIAVPAFLLPVAVETTHRTHKPWRTAFSTLARPQLWLTIAIAYIAGSWLGNHFLAWHPAHSVTGELLSAALRTALVYGLAIALLLSTLAITAELLTRQHACRDPTT